MSHFQYKLYEIMHMILKSSLYNTNSMDLKHISYINGKSIISVIFIHYLLDLKILNLIMFSRT